MPKRVKKEINEEEKAEKQKVFNWKRQEEQFKWILIVIGIILVVAVLSYVLVDSVKKFEYAGIKFEKIKFDKLHLYYSKIPITNEYGETVNNYNFYLRNDPRSLKDIPVTGEIVLANKLIVSIDPIAENECSDAGIAGATLGTFMQASGISYGLAYTNQSYAEERNVTYATCQENYGPTMQYIVVQRGEQTEIKKETSNCYVISFKDCDIMKATERFMVAAIAHSNGVTV